MFGLTTILVQIAKQRASGIKVIMSSIGSSRIKLLRWRLVEMQFSKNKVLYVAKNLMEDKQLNLNQPFLNQSGLSGLDESSNHRTTTDPQARDFMIDRFLPAAESHGFRKTLETPHYAPRKQPAVQEQPRQLKKVVNGDKRPQLRYGPSFAFVIPIP
ncbi:hypothetical protein HAX54_028701 [Datura stramonium]|uniref:Uncharacterized protein n=1 Tax=Datura stramonium TaxID=4076 RepID=A0ABS8S9T0_DATST|nr:hypothetical protein [Datura stramonium]